MGDFDLSELEAFGDSLLTAAEKQFPTEVKKMLREQGNQLNRQVKKLARQRVKNSRAKDKPKAKRYLTGWKRGRVYKHTETGSWAVIVRNSRPHAHLVEYGHVQKDHNRQPVRNGERFVKGRYVMRDAARNYEPQFDQAVNNLLDDLLERGLGR